MNDKFAAFQKNYDQAVESIKRFLEPGEYEPQMNGLVKWMMETDANQYSYLPAGWAGSTESAQSFDSLLHMIHHAVYDDGDITFVTVNDEPRIVFAWHGEDNFRNYVLSDIEKDPEKRWPCYEVKVLDIKPNEFGPLYDAYYAKQIKHWFMANAERNTVEFAIEHYQKYKLFDPAWIAEFEKNKELKNERTN
jgi:hypothetical protein